MTWFTFWLTGVVIMTMNTPLPEDCMTIARMARIDVRAVSIFTDNTGAIYRQSNVKITCEAENLFRRVE